MCDLFISSFCSMFLTTVFICLLCAVFHAKFTTNINQLKKECVFSDVLKCKYIYCFCFVNTFIIQWIIWKFSFNVQYIQLICLFSKHLTVEQVYQINVWQLFPVWHVFFAKLLFTILYLKAIFQRSKVMLQWRVLLSSLISVIFPRIPFRKK